LGYSVKKAFEGATHWYHRFREIIYTHIAHHVYVFDGEIEADESYFGGRRKGKRGRGALGKTIVFGLYKRNGYVYTLSVSDTRTYTLYSIIKEYVQPDSIIYTDTYRSYDILDVSDFQHCRINHSKEFARDNNHINGIENFWNQAKRHMRKYNGIRKSDTSNIS
jgi:transposase